MWTCKSSVSPAVSLTRSLAASVAMQWIKRLQLIERLLLQTALSYSCLPLQIAAIMIQQFTQDTDVCQTAWPASRNTCFEQQQQFVCADMQSSILLCHVFQHIALHCMCAHRTDLCCLLNLIFLPEPHSSAPKRNTQVGRMQDPKERPTLAAALSLTSTSRLHTPRWP